MDLMSLYGKSTVGGPEKIRVPSDEELASRYRKASSVFSRLTEEGGTVCEPSEMYKHRPQAQAARIQL